MDDRELEDLALELADRMLDLQGVFKHLTAH